MIKIKLNEVSGFENASDFYYVVREGDVCWVEGQNGRMKSRFEKNGYKRIGLKQKDGKQKMILEHRLFAICFIPNPENKPVINHIDNNPANNLLSNLEWVTYQENTLHSVKQNRWFDSSGENHGACKISDKQVQEIFELRKSGLLLSQISDLIGCSKSQISKILAGQSRSKKT